MDADPPPDDCDRIVRRDELRRVAARIVSAEWVSAPLFVAAAESTIALIHVHEPTLPWPAETIARVTRPTVVLISGDLGWGEASYGPDRWRCAKPLQRWATAAIVHGSAGKREQYEDAILLAALFGRLAFIETTSSLANSWNAFMHPVPTTTILPCGSALNIGSDAISLMRTELPLSNTVLWSLAAESAWKKGPDVGCV